MAKTRFKKLNQVRGPLALAAICFMFQTGTFKANAAVAEDESTPAAATVRTITPIHSVAIEIRVAPELAGAFPKKKQGWDAACTNLVSVFSEGKSLWESGPASSTSCKVGERAVASAGTPNANDFKIIVDITKAGDTIAFLLGMPGKAKSKVKSEPTVSIPLTEWSAAFLSDQEFASLIAYSLLDFGPALGRMDRSRLSLKDGVLSLAEYKEQRFKTKKFDRLDPLQTLTFYRLEQDAASGRLFAAHLGDAKLINVEKIKVIVGTGSSARATFVPTAKYSVDQKFKDSDDGSSRVWLHSPQGSGGQNTTLKPAIAEAHQRLISAARSGLLKNLFSKGYDSISDLLFQTAASGYVGLRYGTQLLKGDKLLENGRMYGLLVEVRSGPLNGIKFYYDKFPKTAYTSGQKTVDLEWTRLVLGKSFSFKIPYFINRLELTPKLGRYYLTSNQPIESDASGTVISTQKFEIRNQPSFSLEISAERASKHYTARGWYALDRAISFLPILGSSAVSAERVGADLFWNSGINFKTFGMDYVLNFLAFGAYESLTIEDLHQVDLAAGDVAVSALQLRSAFVGFGIVLNW